MHTPTPPRTCAWLGSLFLALSGTSESIAQTFRAAADRATVTGVFEAISHDGDLKLNDVFFVSDEIGWVAGAGGTILYTKDGGATWTAQRGGDSQSSEDGFHALYFVDATHGWARSVGSKRLWRTTDGENWSIVHPAETAIPYVFVSTTRGFTLYGNEIYRTLDGGATWKPAFSCQVKVKSGGMTYNNPCPLAALHFPTARVGYAVSGNVAGSFWAVARTEDGGETWNAWTIAGDGNAPQQVFFVDESTGFVASKTVIQRTTDGGRTWTIVSDAGYLFWLRFADPEVGWSPYVSGGLHFRWTTNSGKSWNSRPLAIGLPFNTYVNGFSVPSRKRAYFVSDHGLIYRYRVVPASERTPDSIDAPAMPAVNDAYAESAAKLRRDADLLQRKLSAAKSAPAVAAQPGVSAEQGRLSQFMRECCAKELEALQVAASSYEREVSAATVRYRNLNLAVAGSRMVSDLLVETNGIRESARTLHSASDQASASVALQNLSLKLDSAAKILARGFDDPPPLPEDSRAAGGDPRSSGEGSQAATDNAPANTQRHNPLDGAAEKLKEKLKKKLPF